MRSTSVDAYLEEIDHIQRQLTKADAKIALHTGQWCKAKMNYVGLLVGHHSIEPQSSSIQAIQTIKAPSNLSDLHSGMCNYSGKNS